MRWPHVSCHLIFPMIGIIFILLVSFHCNQYFENFPLDKHALVTYLTYWSKIFSDFSAVHQDHLIEVYRCTAWGNAGLNCIGQVLVLGCRLAGSVALVDVWLRYDWQWTMAGFRKWFFFSGWLNWREGWCTSSRWCTTEQELYFQMS